MDFNKFLDDLIGPEYKGKDGKMHSYVNIFDEEDKKPHREDQYKKIITHLRLIFPRIPTNKLSTKIMLDAPPQKEETHLVKKKEQLITPQRAEIIGYRMKLTIIFWFLIQKSTFEKNDVILAKLKKFCDNICAISKRGSVFSKKSFQTLKEKIDANYNKIPQDALKGWQNYYQEKLSTLPPPNFAISSKNLKKRYYNNPSFRNTIESFKQVIYLFNGQISALTNELIECQSKKEFILTPLTKQEEDFIRFFMEITTFERKKDFEKLKDNAWELIPLEKRQKLLKYIDKLYTNPLIINKYVRANSIVVLREAIDSLHLMLNNPILYRIRIKLDDISSAIDDFKDTPTPEQIEIFSALERATQRTLQISKKICKEKDMNLLIPFYELNMNF